ILTYRCAAASRDAQMELVGSGAVVRELPRLSMRAHHEVRSSNVVARRLAGVVSAAQARALIDFADLLLTPGLGARTVRALALVAEVVYGAPCRFSDPARFSLAHGGKDRHP